MGVFSKSSCACWLVLLSRLWAHGRGSGLPSLERTDSNIDALVTSDDFQTRNVSITSGGEQLELAPNTQAFAQRGSLMRRKVAAQTVDEVSDQVQFNAHPMQQPFWTAYYGCREHHPHCAQAIDWIEKCPESPEECNSFLCGDGLGCLHEDEGSCKLWLDSIYESGACEAVDCAKAGPQCALAIQWMDHCPNNEPQSARGPCNEFLCGHGLECLEKDPKSCKRWLDAFEGSAACLPVHCAANGPDCAKAVDWMDHCPEDQESCNEFICGLGWDCLKKDTTNCARWLKAYEDEPQVCASTQLVVKSSTTLAPNQPSKYEDEPENRADEPKNTADDDEDASEPLTPSSTPKPSTPPSEERNSGRMACAGTIGPWASLLLLTCFSELL